VLAAWNWAPGPAEPRPELIEGTPGQDGPQPTPLQDGEDALGGRRPTGAAVQPRLGTPPRLPTNSSWLYQILGRDRAGRCSGTMVRQETPRREEGNMGSDAADEQRDEWHRSLHHTPGSDLSTSTAQSPGMLRLEAISGRRCGAEKLWMGQTRVAAGVASADHHHGESETGIYVVSGHPSFVFARQGAECASRPNRATTSSCHPSSPTGRRTARRTRRRSSSSPQHPRGHRRQPAEPLRRAPGRQLNRRGEVHLRRPVAAGVGRRKSAPGGGL